MVVRSVPIFFFFLRRLIWVFQKTNTLKAVWIPLNSFQTTIPDLVGGKCPFLCRYMAARKSETLDQLCNCRKVNPIPALLGKYENFCYPGIAGYWDSILLYSKTLEAKVYVYKGLSHCKAICKDVNKPVVNLRVFFFKLGHYGTFFN